MRIETLVLLALLSILGSCAVDADKSEVADKKLIGTWQWTQTEDFDPENYHERLITPAIRGTSASLEFTNDGSFSQRENNAEIKAGTFNVFQEGSVIMMSQSDTLDYNYSITSSNLILEDLSDSGIVFTYVKIKSND